MFQSGRTATTVATLDHLSEQFGKAILQKSLERRGERDLLEYLPKVRIVTTTSALMYTIAEHITIRPLIDDLECSLFVNATNEDFITSDHPVAMCNSLPASYPSERRTGFASRGLIILYPISPRGLIFLSDREIYNVEKTAAGVCTLRRGRDVVELNLAQCAGAYENLYFASPERVLGTLEAFRKHPDALRPPPPALREVPLQLDDKSRRILFDMPRDARRLPLPKVVQFRHAVKTGRHKVGDAVIRDAQRVAVVETALDRARTLAEEPAGRSEERG